MIKRVLMAGLDPDPRKFRLVAFTTFENLSFAPEDADLLDRLSSEARDQLMRDQTNKPTSNEGSAA